MQDHGLQVDAVELDPAVAELAIKYFPVRYGAGAMHYDAQLHSQ